MKIETKGKIIIKVSSIDNEIDFVKQDTKVECNFNNQKENLPFNSSDFILQKNQNDRKNFDIEIPQGALSAEISLTPIIEKYDVKKLIVRALPEKIDYLD